MDEPDSTEATPTVGDRLRAAGLSEESIQAHMARGAVRLGDQQVTDLEQLAPRSADVLPYIGPS